VFALEKWGQQRGMVFPAAGERFSQQLTRSGSSSNKHKPVDATKAPYILRVARLPEPPATGSRHAPLEFNVPKHSIHVRVEASEQLQQDDREGDQEMLDLQDGQPQKVRHVCSFTEDATYDLEDYDEHFFWPANDLLIRVEPDSTDDKGKVVAVLKQVTFYAQADASGSAAAKEPLSNAAVGTLNDAQMREKAGWLAASWRAQFDKHMPPLLQGEVSVEHGKGQLFVLRSQQPAVWAAKLHQHLKTQSIVSGQVDGQPKGVMFKGEIDFEWRKAMEAEKEAQAQRLDNRLKQEAAIFGQKMQLKGNFRLTDDANQLAAAIQKQGGKKEELTAGLWSEEAVEKVEIANMGKGDAKTVCAFVVMKSEAEAELLLQMINRFKMLTWGGKAVSAFICRKWKPKEQRAQKAKEARKETRSASAGSGEASISAGNITSIRVNDKGEFPRLPAAAQWGKGKATTQSQPAVGRPTAPAAASPTTTTPATAAISNPGSLEARGQQLAAEVATLKKEGVAARAQREVLETQLQSTAKQMHELMQTVSELAMEVKAERQSNAAWQETVTQQLQALTARLSTVLPMLCPAPPAAETIEQNHAGSKRGRDDSPQPSSAGESRHRGKILALDDEIQAEGDEDETDMEEQQEEGSVSVAAPPASSDRPPNTLQQGHAHGSPHPQPQGKVEGGEH
jgi:hypothetical protein